MLSEENHSGTDPDAEEISDSEGSDDDRNHKHKRRESSPCLPQLNQPNDQNAPTPQEDSSFDQLNKKRQRPFENKMDKRRFRPNQFQGRGRGRGRNNMNNNNNNNNNQWDPRFNMGPMPPNLDMHDLALVAGLGGPGPYGFMPGMSNGMMMDPVPVPMHPMGPGMGVMDHHHHMGMPRQRCADFEERGFCLRGDMCPMAHGVNRIVVDDVQSLNQLKLLGPGPKPGMPIKDALRPNGMLTSVISAPDADAYDPDQPLWNNNSNNNINGPKPDPLTAGTTSSPNHTVTEDPNSSVWGRINANTNNHPKTNPNLHEGGETSTNRQRAIRTLYICDIPQKDNRVESLFAHFKKFGTVIDIYVPANKEKAFVQFSKREEAESALAAPDAVMGNRFIRVLWANRDRITDEKGKANFVNTQNFGAKMVGTSTSTSNLVNGAKLVPVPVTVPARPAVLPPAAQVQQVQQQMESPVAKKTESMELLEKLRKKQEDLARKRDEFRKQLAKLEKQSIGKKGENENQNIPKVQNSVSVSDSPKPSTTKKDIAMEKRAKIDPVSSFRPNRFKLDNRPVQFRILSLPHDISDVMVLKDHLSQFGEIASITLEEKENEKEALVKYTKHEYAERAYSSGSSFQEHNLSFKWVPTQNSTKTAVSSNSKSSPVKPELEKSVSPVNESTTKDGGSARGDDAVAANSGTDGK